MQNLSAQDRYCALVAALKQKNIPPGGEAMMEAILAAIPPDARRIVDLGCNTGWVTRQIAAAFPAANVIGIDINADMIATARAVAEREGTRATFECVDGRAMHAVAADADVIACGGSAAFFGRPREVYAAVTACLRPGGQFIDCHYLYEATVPAELRRQEKLMFGLGWMPEGIEEIAGIYEDAGLVMRHIRRLPRFRFEDGKAALFARDILRGIPDVRALVDAMVERRELIDELARYRHPYILVATAGRPEDKFNGSRRDILRSVATLDLFSGPIERQPMATIREFLPYRFLAYVGDPDAAPGGARSVDRLGRILRRAGIGPDARVLDIGCFTGLSTIVLATHFANVTGLDTEADFVSVARSLAATLGSQARFEVGDGAKTGYTDGHFDVVTMTATLAYTPEPRAILEEIHRILAKDGLLAEFVYHHFDRRSDTQAEIRAAVGPDVVTAPLSERLAFFASAGFELIELVAVDTGAAHLDDQRTFKDYVVAREHERDPSKSTADLDEFGQFFSHYTTRLSDRSDGPIAYLCMFSKARRPSPT